jgi:hypothetical protein
VPIITAGNEIVISPELDVLIVDDKSAAGIG